MKIAVEGCCHGELDAIYDTLELLEKKNNFKVDLLLICGDFQSVRNTADMNCMAVPPKHRKMNTFYKYYSGEKVAPVLTIFIGGNHEASNYLQELSYGGWVAPKIYYMGYAGVLQFGGVRIGGMSGIFKGKDFMKGHFEHPPYSEDTKRSAYHVRNLDVFRLKQLKIPVDIFLSHDWPRNIYRYGDVNHLLRKKSFFTEEVEKGILGNPVAMDLLRLLQPTYWFSAHLHVKFPAVVQHTPDDDSKITKFLALDKCLPRRQFLQVLDVPHDPSKPMRLELDAEWLAILKSTNHLLSLSRSYHYPGSAPGERSDFVATKEEMNAIIEDFGGDLKIPENFKQTVTAFDPSQSNNRNKIPELKTEINPQTTLLCSMLDLTDPNAVFLGKDSTFNLPDDADQNDSRYGDQAPDDVDEDYESEPSFVSLSGSERSFSDRSISFVSNDNESFSSFGNPDEISIDEGEDDIENSKSGNGNTNNAACTNDVEDNLDTDELAEIMKAQKASKIKRMSLSERLEMCKEDTSKSDSAASNSETDLLDNEDENSEFAEIVAAQKKESDLSKSSSEFLDNANSSKNSSLSSLDCKALEISDDDPELQEMLKAQKKNVTIETVDDTNKSKNSSQVIEASMDNEDIEFQDIVTAQKTDKGLEGDSLNEIQQDFVNLRPVYQSSPVVSLDDRVAQSLAGKDLALEKRGREKAAKSTESPVNKRFRRRNQELYSDNSTGDED